MSGDQLIELIAPVCGLNDAVGASLSRHAGVIRCSVTMRCHKIVPLFGVAR